MEVIWLPINRADRGETPGRCTTVPIMLNSGRVERRPGGFRLFATSSRWGKHKTRFWGATQTCDINISYFATPAWHFQLIHASRCNGSQDVIGFALDNYYFHYFVSAVGSVLMNATKCDNCVSGWRLPVKQRWNLTSWDRTEDVTMRQKPQADQIGRLNSFCSPTRPQTLFHQQFVTLCLIYRQTVHVCPHIKPDPHIFLFTLYKYYIVFSQNQDMAAWGTFYKYGLTGYMAFRVLCEFTGLAWSKSLSVSAALRDDLCAPASLWFDLSQKWAFFIWKCQHGQGLSEAGGGERGEVLHERVCQETIKQNHRGSAISQRAMLIQPIATRAWNSVQSSVDTEDCQLSSFTEQDM